MKKHFALTGLLVLAVAASAQDAPDVKAILKKVDETTKAVKAISYKATATGEGDLKDRLPKTEAVIRMQAKGDKESDDFAPLTHMELSFTPPGASEPRKLIVVTDGTELIRINATDRKFARGKLPEAQRLMPEVTRFVTMIEFMHPTPFSDELNADTTKYEGKKSINGAECHVIHVVYSGGQGEARWYYGVQDNLPHRVDRIAPAAWTLELAEVDAAPKLTPETFAVKPPEGFAEEGGSGLLAAGSPAPAWTLSTLDGKSVSSNELGGKVVVLNFWATWAASSTASLPRLQKISETFKDKGVLAFAVGTWENEDAKPADYAKEKGYSFGLLAGTDEFAKLYRVTALPTIYVIGKDGKVVYAAPKYDPKSDDAIMEAIAAAAAK